MAYSYGYEDESPRFALGSMWFLVGVMVFAFSVLIMTAIVTASHDDGYYLNVRQPQTQQVKPGQRNVTDTASKPATASSTGATRQTR